MKSKILILLILILSTTNVYAQIPNVFLSSDAIIDFLDGKSYVVPNFGMIKFEYNKSDTKKRKEIYNLFGSSDDFIDLVFDVIVLRNQSKKRDKFDYQIELHFNLKDNEIAKSLLIEDYVQTFTLMKKPNNSVGANGVFPIRNFPVFFNLFADGDLYYVNFKDNKLSFSEFKNSFISSTKFSLSNSFYKYFNIPENSPVNHIKCQQISK